jgi:hypothetical protein
MTDKLLIEALEETRDTLVKAGALILAEIERLDRAAPTPSKGEANG